MMTRRGHMVTTTATTTVGTVGRPAGRPAAAVQGVYVAP